MHQCDYCCWYNPASGCCNCPYVMRRKACEKALDQRGISASLMFYVVLRWNQVLEEGLENYPEENYAMYGLPLFKATAVKYGWENPIGDDNGDEEFYNE